MSTDKKLASEWTKHAFQLYLGKTAIQPAHSPNINYLATLGASSVVAWALNKKNALPHTVPQHLSILMLHNKMHNKVFVNAWHQLKTDLIKNGIQCIPLKGIYMLQDTYAKHTEIRMLADIDVLVSPADFLRSLQVLSSIGYTVSDKAMSAAKQSYICEVGVKIRVDNITVSIDLHRYPHNYPLFKEFPAQDIFNKPYKIDSWSTVDAVTWILTHKAKNGLIGDFKELFDYSVLTSNLSDDEWRQLLMRIKQLGLENPFHMFVLQEKYWFNCIEIINKHKRLDSLGLTSSTRIRLLSMIFGKDSKRTNITSIPLFRAYIGTLFTMKNFLRSIVSIALFVKYKLSIKSKSTSP